ncbi:MAG: hypothetical protein E7313_02465 [Clostridiales bacterium]|nr:hypothetical protein [Clostridiales bacterium]
MKKYIERNIIYILIIIAIILIYIATFFIKDIVSKAPKKDDSITIGGIIIMTNDEYMEIAKKIYNKYKEQLDKENVDSILGNIVGNKPIINNKEETDNKNENDKTDGNKGEDGTEDNKENDGSEEEKEDDDKDNKDEGNNVDDNKNENDKDDGNKEDDDKKEENKDDSDKDEDDKDDGNEDDDEIIDNEARIKISEDGTDWNELKELRIFYNEFYEDEPKIAPGVSGEYKYTVENNWDKDVIYHMNFSEENPLNINMVYKLKDDGKYVFGDENTWVSHDDLNKPDIVIESGETHIYTLEWKWEHSDNDTQIGETEGAKYKIFIKVYAEQKGEV